MVKVLPGVVEEGSVSLGGKSSTNFAMPYGNTGTWHKVDAYLVAGYNAIPAAKEAKLVPDIEIAGRNASERGTWDRLLYSTNRYEEAVEMNTIIRGNDEFPPQLVTQFGLSELEAVPNPLEFEQIFMVDKKNYGTKRSEPWQLITLPSIVHAYAVYQGWEVPEISFHELTDTKDFQKLEGDALTELYNRLVLQRADLWKALGESNVKACSAIGSKFISGKEIKNDTVTTSEKLSDALRFASSNWTGAFYARVGAVSEPSSGAGRVPVLVELYDSKEDAIEKLAKKAEKREHVPSEYDGLHFPASFAEAMTVAEFAGALASDTMQLKKTWEESTGAAKVKAKAALLSKLTEFELTEAQFAEWATKLNF